MAGAHGGTRSLTITQYGHTMGFMAATVVRTTYALDADTVRRLEGLAREWNVSKSEALRRAIRAATASPAPDERVRALDELQASMRLTRESAQAWVRAVGAERRRSTNRRVARR